jgi:hypothetical protein
MQDVDGFSLACITDLWDGREAQAGKVDRRVKTAAFGRRLGRDVELWELRCALDEAVRDPATDLDGRDAQDILHRLRQEH